VLIIKQELKINEKFEKGKLKKKLVNDYCVGVQTVHNNLK
jgi:hypothetical protein